MKGEECRLCGTLFGPRYQMGVLVGYLCANGHTPTDGLMTSDFCEPWVPRRPQDWAPRQRAVIFRQREST